MADIIKTPKRLLSYVIASDDGLAPNIDGGVCTLSVCKPIIRKTAQVGEDMILGFSSRWHGEHRLIYAMSVDEKIAFDAYFNAPEFAMKKPSDTHSAGDNFYQPTPCGKSHYIENTHAAHFNKKGKIMSQTSAPYALIGRRFWYFGDNAPNVPFCILKDTDIAIPGQSRRAHRVTDDPEKIQSFMQWLERHPQGIHGTPRDCVPENHDKRNAYKAEQARARKTGLNNT